MSVYTTLAADDRAIVDAKLFDHANGHDAAADDEPSIHSKELA
jgi:hypothetical protein